MSASLLDDDTLDQPADIHNILQDEPEATLDQPMVSARASLASVISAEKADLAPPVVTSKKSSLASLPQAPVVQEQKVEEELKVPSLIKPTRPAETGPKEAVLADPNSNDFYKFRATFTFKKPCKLA